MSFTTTWYHIVALPEWMQHWPSVSVRFKVGSICTAIRVKSNGCEKQWCKVGGTWGTYCGVVCKKRTIVYTYRGHMCLCWNVWGYQTSQVMSIDRYIIINSSAIANECFVCVGWSVGGKNSSVWPAFGAIQPIRWDRIPLPSVVHSIHKLL